jgi:glycerophosphoryl diester phosphodiesterase
MRLKMNIKQHRWFTIFILALSVLWGFHLAAAATADAGGTNPNYRSFVHAGELQAYMKWHPARKPLISAHRGGPMGNFPENALETFENTLKYGPCLIECDVQVTKDGRLVMMHDNTLDRTTTGKGKVSHHTLAQIKKLFLKDAGNKITGFRVPTLAEVLGWTVGRAVLTIDVKAKDGVPFEQVIFEIRGYKAEGHVIIIVYNIEDMLKVHRLAADLMISVAVNGIKGVEKLFAAGVPAENLIAFVGVYEPDSSVYEMLHEKGIRAVLGTMHNLDNKAAARGVSVYRQLYKNGADILSTDQVTLVSRAFMEGQ